MGKRNSITLFLGKATQKDKKKIQANAKRLRLNFFPFFPRFYSSQLPGWFFILWPQALFDGLEKKFFFFKKGSGNEK